MVAKIDDGFYAEVLQRVGVPVNNATIGFMKLWARFEGGHTNGALWNPLNTSMPVAGAKSWHGINVKTYPSRAAGIEATAKTLTQRNATAYGYTRILNALKASNPAAAVSALVNSAWASGHYGAKKLRGGGYDASTSTIGKAYARESGSTVPVSNVVATTGNSNIPPKGTAWIDPLANAVIDDTGKIWAPQSHFNANGPKGLRLVLKPGAVSKLQKQQGAGLDPGAVIDLGAGLIPGPSDTLGMALGGPDTLGITAPNGPLGLLYWFNDNKVRIGLGLLGVLAVLIAVMYQNRGVAMQAAQMVPPLKAVSVVKGMKG